jgi:GDPmannose 4,6-dehydratase
MKALIFGSNGQDGYYLSQLLLKEGWEVTGISRQGIMAADIRNFNQTSDLIKRLKPDYIFHLAANSTTRHDSLFENHETIATGTLNVLESVKNFSPHSKVFISGSGLQFKNSTKAISEADEFEARDVYCISRIQSVYAARYFRNLGIQVYVGYLFNHESPRRSEQHVSKMIAEAAKRIKSGSKERISLGDVNVIKEWTFAGDTVKAINQLMSQDNIFEAVIGSGIGHSIEDWLKVCFGMISEDWRVHVDKRENFIPEYKQLISDPSLIFSLGWTPEINFEQLASMMMK